MYKNEVRMTGYISGVTFSHRTKDGRVFRKGYINCERDSGVTDSIPIMAEGFLENDKYVSVIGELSTRNITTDGNKHLNVYVFAKEISVIGNGEIPYDRKDENSFKGEGYICNVRPIRKTPRGVVIRDFTIAFNKEKISYYVPSIAWNENARFINEDDIGAMIRVSGRVQSRVYMKRLDSGAEMCKTAYELSCNHIVKVL